MGYKTLDHNEGFIVVDEDSFEIPTADKPNRVTPNLNESEFKINVLKVKDCPINESCMSLVGIDEVTYFCKHLESIHIPQEGAQTESHAHVVCGKLKGKKA